MSTGIRNESFMNKCPIDKNEIPDENLSCSTCLFRNLSLCSELEESDLELLNKNKSVLHFAKKEYIFKQGIRPSGLYILAGGKVKNARISENGFEQIVSLHKPVDFLGFYDFSANQNHTYSAIALEDCRICYVPTKDFQEILNHNNAFAVKVLNHVSGAFSHHVHRMTNLTGKHMRGRMADTLLYLYELFEVAKSDNVLRIELKRRDLASMAIMNTSNAVRTLSEFSKADWITLEKHQISFHNLPALLRTSITN